MPGRGGGAAAANTPPPGHNWLTTYTPQEIATIQRTVWDAQPFTHTRQRAHLVAGKLRLTSFNDEAIDREVRHTHGDYHGLCSHQNRADEAFQLLCSMREPRTKFKPPSEEQKQRQLARALAAEEKIKQRLRDRVQKQRDVETRLLPSHPPGSRLARERRAALDEEERRLTSTTPTAEAYERWRGQFGEGQHKTERLTGRYVHSLDDVGRIERVPSERRSPGRNRLTETKTHSFFSTALRDYSGTERSPWAGRAKGRTPRSQHAVVRV